MSQSEQTTLPFPTPTITFSYIRGAANNDVLEAIEEWLGRKASQPLGDSAANTVMAVSGRPGCGKTRLIEELGLMGDTPSDQTGAMVIDDAHLVPPMQLFAEINTAISQRQLLLLIGEGRAVTWGSGKSAAGAADLQSRLNAVPNLTLDAPDEPMLAQALADALKQVGLALPQSTISWAVTRLRRNFSAVESLVTKAVAHSSNIRSSKALLEQVMKDNPDLCLASSGC